VQGPDTKANEETFFMASLADVLVRQLLDGRHIASLATENEDGSIHIVAVWYWFDGTHVRVATSSRSRKARNLQSNPKVSLMIDARDPAASYGVTIAGTAQILSGDVSRKSNVEIHRKYLSEAALADARVGPVFAAWDDVTIQIVPSSVIAWDMRQADRQFFGGVLEKNPAYLLPLQR
jgi:PPOX class probable F420-dependent enzyme